MPISTAAACAATRIMSFENLVHELRLLLKKCLASCYCISAAMAVQLKILSIMERCTKASAMQGRVRTQASCLEAIETCSLGVPFRNLAFARGGIFPLTACWDNSGSIFYQTRMQTRSKS